MLAVHVPGLQSWSGSHPRSVGHVPLLAPNGAASSVERPPSPAHPSLHQSRLLPLRNAVEWHPPSMRPHSLGHTHVRVLPWQPCLYP